ncbi:hypothetical protein EON64_18905, partial [archaeon]
MMRRLGRYVIEAGISLWDICLMRRRLGGLSIVTDGLGKEYTSHHTPYTIHHAPYTIYHTQNRSGDVGEFDSDGFLKITGRIKDLIVTSGGENIPPSLIEQEVLKALPELSHVVVTGDQRNFLCALLSLQTEPDQAEGGGPGDSLSKACIHRSNIIGSSARTYSEAVRDQAWRDYVDQGIKLANTKATSNAQCVRKWEWLPRDLSERDGDITPTLKVKREAVIKKYEELIEGMYKE